MSRTEIEDGMFAMVFSSGIFDDGTELYAEYDFPPGVAGDKHIAPLVSRGCGSKCLLIILDKAVDIHLKSLSLAPAKTLGNLANKMRRIAKKIREVEVPCFLAILEELQDRKRHPYVEGTKLRTDFGTYRESDLAESLEEQAFLYDEWTRLASQNVLPKAVGTPRLARMCVAWYVKYATRKTYFPEVLKLLKCVGLGEFSTTQLSRELKSFESDYPRCCARLKLFVQEAESNKRRSVTTFITAAPVHASTAI